MTRVLVAFDKFKDALTAREACAAAAAGLRTTHPAWTLDLCPLTDGGEGFGETLTQAVRGRWEKMECTGPRGERIIAALGHVDVGHLPTPARQRLGLATHSAQLAVVEMAAASGLALLPPDRRDPWQTSSVGTGEQILAAAKAGADAILLGVGGSATNDLGMGALAALGCKFFDPRGAPVAHPIPAAWEKIVRIERPAKFPPLFIACDVTNPLLGPRGATATFARQKGLRTEDMPRLEAQCARMAAMLCAACGQPLTLTETPGAGAAGGMAFGLQIAADAQLVPGFALVADWLDLPSRLAAADLVLTGEGRFDATSLGGKGPGSLVDAARTLGKPVHVFAGALDLPGDWTGRNEVQAHAITPRSLPLSEALPRTAEFLSAAISRLV